MTSIPNTPSEYPTAWHFLDIEKMVEGRQIADDTYQIKNKDFMVTLSAEGFDLFREGPREDFKAWLAVNKIQSVAIRD